MEKDKKADKLVPSKLGQEGLEAIREGAKRVARASSSARFVSPKSSIPSSAGKKI